MHPAFSQFKPLDPNVSKRIESRRSNAMFSNPKFGLKTDYNMRYTLQPLPKMLMMSGVFLPHQKSRKRI